jgi:TetR/AcrR family transcriptional repressor of nem operon
MARSDARTRDELIDSTRALLWERGYAATSPRAILDRAGVGQGSMYHYFTGKEQLATVALDRTAQELVAGAAAALSGDGPAVDRISAYLLRHRDVLRGCPLGRMAGDTGVAESAGLQEIVAATFGTIRGLATAVIAQGVSTGEFASDVTPADLADTVLAVVQGGYVLARAAGNAAPFDRAVAGAVALLDLARSEGRSERDRHRE